jgi:DNA polymerase-4
VPTIFHVDMDAFFVSVEELYDPSLKGKAVVVGGRADERGVVAAASYEARKFGVHSAMPLRTAAKMCPHAIFLDGHPERYREESVRVHAVLHEFSPLVEMASIDEAYLDMTGTERLHGPPLRAAHLLHARMKELTRLNCSVGIGTSRVVAKICSDQAKPNGVLWVVPGCERTFLTPLPVRKIPGVGKVTEEHLLKLGVKTAGDLTSYVRERPREHLGDWALALADKAAGIDAGGWFDEAIGEDSGPKSVSHEHTFSVDVLDREILETKLAKLVEKVCRRLREYRLHARRIQLKLRYADFSTFTRARTLEHPSQIDTELLPVVRELFRRNCKPGSSIRLLGVQAAMFAEPDVQLHLDPGARDERWRQAMGAADKLRDKFGEQAVSLGAGMQADIRERTHDNPAALPGKRKKK